MTRPARHDPAGGSGWSLISLMFSAPLIGVRLRWPNVLHAIDMDGLPIKSWPNGKARSVCGLSGLRVVASGRLDWPVASPAARPSERNDPVRGVPPGDGPEAPALDVQAEGDGGCVTSGRPREERCVQRP
jgi:hypothetical protein